MPILILIVMIFFIAPTLYKWYSSHTYSASAEDKLLLDSLIVHFASPSVPPVEQPVHQFKFDPNFISLDSLILLGLKRDIAQRIINYRNAGGRFQEKQDLKKIYGFPSEIYDALAHLMELPEKRSSRHDKTDRVTKVDIESTEIFAASEKTVTAFDINRADTSQLKRIYGIGTVLSARIVKYRDLLGGFVKKEQLREVYGIKEEVYNTLSAQIFIDPDYVPERININKDSVRQLAAHPYVPYSLAKTIYNYRLQHGPYQSTSDLLKIHLFDSVLLENVVPYIDF